MKIFKTIPRIKNYLTVLFLSSLILLSGCSSDTSKPSSTAPSADQLTLVTSFYPMYIMALNITAEVPGIELINLTSPQTGCLHDYQLTPNDVKTLNKADIFIVNGAGTESFLDKAVKQQPQLKIVTASQGIELIKGQGEAGDNPHVWVSIAGAIKEVDNIAEQLAVLDPSHASLYRRNAETYTSKLRLLSQEMHAQLEGVDNRSIVTFHEAFPYFAQEFGLNIVAIVEREPGSEPNAAELANTIKMIRKSQAKALFTEPQYPPGAAQTIARDTEAKVYILDPAVSGPDSPDAYLDIMRKNLKTLSEALR